MALATQCPHCKTSFRVAKDQLKLHAGMVRCGACHQTFNGIEHLVTSSDATGMGAGTRTGPDDERDAADTQTLSDLSDINDFNDVSDVSAPVQMYYTEQPLPEALPEKPADIVKPPDPRPWKVPRPIDDKAQLHITTKSNALDFDFEAMLPPALKKSDAPKNDLLAQPAHPDVASISMNAQAEAKANTDIDAPLLFSSEIDEELAQAFEVMNDLEAEPADPKSLLRERASVEADDATEKPKSSADQGNPYSYNHREQFHRDIPSTSALLVSDTSEHAEEPEAEPPTPTLSYSEESPVSYEVDALTGESYEHDPAGKPDFVLKAEHSQGQGKKVRSLMAALLIVLIPAAVLQTGYAFRDTIAAWLPQTKPTLIEACKLLRCEIKFLAQIDQISIESHEIQSFSEKRNRFLLTVQLQNKSHTIQAWPTIELSLNDPQNKPLLIKAFKPADYLTDKKALTRGFAPESEQSIKLLYDSPDIVAARYLVAVYY